MFLTVAKSCEALLPLPLPSPPPPPFSSRAPTLQKGNLNCENCLMQSATLSSEDLTRLRCRPCAGLHVGPVHRGPVSLGLCAALQLHIEEVHDWSHAVWAVLEVQICYCQLRYGTPPRANVFGQRLGWCWDFRPWLCRAGACG